MENICIQGGKKCAETKIKKKNIYCIISIFNDIDARRYIQNNFNTKDSSKTNKPDCFIKIPHNTHVL